MLQADRPRAKRLTFPVAISYRLADSEDWLQARVLNISESGMMFAPAAVEPGRAIEVIFATAVPIESLPQGKLICIAHVVRATPAGTVAARFEACRFLLDTDQR